MKQKTERLSITIIFTIAQIKPIESSFQKFKLLVQRILQLRLELLKIINYQIQSYNGNKPNKFRF